MKTKSVSDLRETEAAAAAGTVKYAVCRPINGIALNGVEYLCGKDGEPLLFGSIWDAFYFLKQNGHMIDSMDREDIKIVIMEAQNNEQV